jgi:hypothetical protein
MSTIRSHALKIVTTLWLVVIAASAASAFGPVHRKDIQSYWSADFFLTTVLGPLAVFRWPYPAIEPHVSDYVISISFSAFVISWTLLYMFRPSRWSFGILAGLMAIWLLVGLGVTYAWV